MVIDYLRHEMNEDFYTADHVKTPYYEGYVEVFKNPNHREMLSIVRDKDNDQHSVRMGMDNAGNLFAWKYHVVHSDMEKILDIPWSIRFVYKHPNKFVSLGSGSFEVVWEKYGNRVMDKLNDAIEDLQQVQSSDGKVLWEK